MMNRTLTRRPSVGSFVQLCPMFMLSFIFLSSSGVVVAQGVVQGYVQQNGYPVVQQDGEVITQNYYPAAPRQYYVPQPQSQYFPPPQQQYVPQQYANPSRAQIGFPPPQPRFAPSAPLYINPNPINRPQVNIYGERIISESIVDNNIVGKIFEAPAPPDDVVQTKPPERKVDDPNIVEPKDTDQVKPSTEQVEMEKPDAKATELAEQSKTEDGGEKANVPEEKKPAVTSSDDVATTESKSEDTGEKADPTDTSSEPMGGNALAESGAESPTDNVTDNTDKTAPPSTDQTAEVKPEPPVKAKPNQPTETKPDQVTEAKPDQLSEPTAESPIRSDSFMNPLGPIALDQRDHLFWVTVLTMVAVLPVFILLPIILFGYRRGRKKKGTYQPKWDSSTMLELLMWGVPIVLVVFMSARLWHSTHVLDPYEEIHSKNPTVNLQVVGLDWKWLFIYPDHGIATVGEFTIPVDHPASMVLTTDTVMQSFVIPALGGQIYAMPGMQTKLNLIASQLGSMEGENTQFNGDGFAQQKFMTHVVPVEEFDAWVEEVKQNSVPLDNASYRILARRTLQSKAIADLRTDGMPEGAVYFSLEDKELFNKIMMRYMNHKPLRPEHQPGSLEYDVQDESTTETSSNDVLDECRTFVLNCLSITSATGAVATTALHSTGDDQ